MKSISLGIVQHNDPNIKSYSRFTEINQCLGNIITHVRNYNIFLNIKSQSKTVITLHTQCITSCSAFLWLIWSLTNVTTTLLMNGLLTYTDPSNSFKKSETLIKELELDM